MENETTYWINGTVRLGGSDLTTIAEVDNKVNIIIKETQKTFKGSRIMPIRSHTIGVEILLKISKPIFRGAQLDQILGMHKETGTLNDGATASTNYNLTLNSHFQRAESPILITGINSKTGKKIEIEVKKAVLQNDFDLNLEKENFTQPELEFLVLGDTDNPDVWPIEIRTEDEEV